MISRESDRNVETANRPLEHLDILFSSKSPLVWRAEEEFIGKLREHNDNLAIMNAKTEKEEIEQA